MQPTALHCTSTFDERIWRIKGGRPPSCTMRTLFSAIYYVSDRELGEMFAPDLLLTARFPRAALAARCTSMSELCSRNNMGSKVSRSTSRTSTRHPVSDELITLQHQ